MYVYFVQKWQNACDVEIASRNTSIILNWLCLCIKTTVYILFNSTKHISSHNLKSEHFLVDGSVVNWFSIICATVQILWSIKMCKITAVNVGMCLPKCIFIIVNLFTFVSPIKIIILNPSRLNICIIFNLFIIDRC